jgi:photosystem II stability/assembly factor-like uncharacterized protein
MAPKPLIIPAILVLILAAAVPARADEPPPATRDPAVAAVLDDITPDALGGYIQTLQNYKSRYSYMPGCDDARDYLRQFLLASGYSTHLQEFEGTYLKKVFWGDADKAAWVLTAGSTLYGSTDGGATWRRQVPAAPGYVYDAHFVDAAVGYVASAKGAIIKTEDGGRTWESVRGEKSAAEAVRAIFFLDRDVGWAACGDGTSSRILHTVDGGASWSVQMLPPYGYPHAVAFGDAKKGWAVPNWYEDNVVLRTEDGGAAWTAQDFPVPPADVRSFAAVEGDVAWAAYGAPRLVYTDDGGSSWKFVEMPSGAEGVVTAVCFVDAATGYAAGDGVIYKTEDYGMTWLSLPGVPEVFWGDAAFGDADHGLFIDLFGRELYLTGDGGLTFKSIRDRLDMYWENVIAEKPGATAPDEIILLGAHYDSASDRPADGAPGADANASGVSCVLAAAAAFRNLDVDRTLRLVLFGGGEQSYLGSRAYAEEALSKDENVVAAVILDMVGYDEDQGRRDDVIVRVDGGSIWLGDYVAAVAKLYNLGLLFDYHLYGGPGDHAAFWEARYDSIGLFEGGPGYNSDLTYPYYHTSDDTLDKLNLALAARTAKAAAATVAHLARSDYIGVGDDAVATGSKPRRRPWAVFPNPFTYGSAAGVTFDGVSAPATVSVYDVAGRKVAGLDVAAGVERFVWRPGRRDGGPLAPGVYVYRVLGEGQRKVGKLVVCRP